MRYFFGEEEKKGRYSISSEVHVLLGFGMDGNGSVHCRWCAFFGFARLVTSLSAVMFFFDEMIACSERDEMSVVGRGGYGDRPGTSDVSVA